MGFTFVAAGRFGRTVVLSGEASRPASVTGPFDRESFNSAEQTFTVMVVSFMVAHRRLHRYKPDIRQRRRSAGVLSGIHLRNLRLKLWFLKSNCHGLLV